MAVQSNAASVKQSVKRELSRQQKRAGQLAGTVGRAMRDNIRANIAPKSAGGVFPGYAMTGQLRKSVEATTPKRTRGGWLVVVRIVPRGRVARYAEIHETGGIIRAKRAPYLHFKVQGQWVRIEEVEITRKLYFSRGVARTRRQYPGIARGIR
jgi:hypothetical protein